MDFHTPLKKSVESNRDGMASPSGDAVADDHREVIVKIDSSDRDNESKNDSRMLRSPSYEFWNDGQGGDGGAGFRTDDSRRRDTSLDMNSFRKESCRDSLIQNSDSPVRGVVNNENINANRRGSDSNELEASFGVSNSRNVIDYKGSSSDDEEVEELRLHVQQHARRRTSNSSRALDDEGAGEVLKCTSFQRRASLARTRTQQSRLMDPPDIPFSGPYPKSVRGSVRFENDEDEDALSDVDNPDDFKNSKLDALTIVQWISLVLILTALICTLRIRKWKLTSFRGLFLWEWEVLVLALICGRLVSGWGIRLVVFFIERSFLLRKRVLYFVYGVRKAVQNCIWLGLVLITWNSMFDQKVEANNIFLQHVNNFMVCMLIATSLWLLKTLMVKVLASSFHVNKFFDRIQDALFNQYVIETLSGPPLIEIQNNQEEEERIMEPWKHNDSFKSKLGSGRLQKLSPGRVVSIKYSGTSKKFDEKDQAITIDHLHRLNPENVSAWNMKRLMRIVRHGSLTTLDEHLHQDESGTQIRSEIEAKRAARKIFLNVSRHRSKFIYLDDLMRFLREDEAMRTISLLVGSPEDERVSKAALKNWVVNVFRERKALALTLNDTKTAVHKLHRMVNVLVATIILIICLIILNIATTKVLLLISSQLVLVTFIFGNTCKTIFEAIIFLFVMHPFDVGDRCEIDGVQMIVEEMNILTTVFLRFDNQKIYYPNSSLATKSIGNFYRSPDMCDTIDFLIHVATPAEKIAIIKQRILSFVESNKDHWYSDPVIVAVNMFDINQIKLSVWVTHKINFQDITQRYTRKTTIIEEMVRIFRELDIEYRTYPLDINIRSMPLPVTSSRVPSTWVAPN